MDILITLISIYGLAFLIKESDGPWGIMSWVRNSLIRNKYVGVFFYKLFDCYFCTGCWAGWVIYLLTQQNIKLNIMFVWGLAGGSTCLILDGLISRLQRE